MVLLTYNRFDYFRAVLDSILSQTINGLHALDIYDFYISQDGCSSRESPESVEQHKLISNYLTHFSETYQSITTIKHENNLGIALHFDYVERLLFEEKQYDLVVFFEDDLVLAPGFMQMMDLMAEKFRDDPRIGMFSAFNPEPLTLTQQKERALSYTLMGHNWGFGLFRTFWLRRQIIIDNYLLLVRHHPYKQMPTKLVLKWMEQLGFSPSGPGQDHAKACATNSLGAVRIASVANFGIPIGSTGTNFNEELFVALNFDKIVPYDDIPESAPDLSDDAFKALFKRQASWYCSAALANAIDDPSASVFNDFESRARNGLFHPNYILGDDYQKFLAETRVLEFLNLHKMSEWQDKDRYNSEFKKTIDSKKESLIKKVANPFEAEALFYLVLGRYAGRERAGRNFYDILIELINSDEYRIKYNKFHQIWQPEDIPDYPSMDREGLALFEERLAQSTCFLEFGAGGSTILAAKKGVKIIYSVESDLNWANATRLKAEKLNTKTQIVLHHVDIGKTKEWGWPADDLAKNRWPSYSQSIFTKLFKEAAKPDLILVDGRFRVACFLTSLAYSLPGTRILFDNYYDRPNYHVVERFLKPASRSGRMAEFVVESPETSDFIFSEINKFIYDPS